MGCAFSSKAVPRDPSSVKAAYEKKYNQPRPDIEHVVVLMLENRTFDNVLGAFMDKRYRAGEVAASKWDPSVQSGRYLYDHKNLVRRQGDTSETAFHVWSAHPTNEEIFSTKFLSQPENDPTEGFQHQNQGVYQKSIVQTGDPVTLGGFAQQFYNKELLNKKTITTDFDTKRSPAMHVYLPEQMPAFTELAETFGVSDTYFASAPCQTWPNRLFAATGHCYGYTDNMIIDQSQCDKYEESTLAQKCETVLTRMPQFDDPTVFNKLSENGVEWAIYHDGFPLSVGLCRQLHTTEMLERTYMYADFADHCKKGHLPPFTWIEPRYIGLDSLGLPPNDMHPDPGNNTMSAQKLVADTYQALRSNPSVWSKTLFIINCDEGVGLLDHVPPPRAPNPEAGCNHHFYGQENPEQMEDNPFTRYGTRTCCILASPLLDPGSVVRPSPTSDYPFDHCSVVRTVLDLFVSPDAHLTQRDKLAPSLAPQLRREARPDLGPWELKALPLEESKAPLADSKRSGTCHNIPYLVSAIKDVAGEGDTILKDLAKKLEQFSLLTSGRESHMSKK